LQNITTREPDAKQLEVALVALRGVLNMKIDSSVEMVRTAS